MEYNSKIIYHVFDPAVPEQYKHEHSAAMAFVLGRLERSFYFSELSPQQWASICHDLTFSNYLNQLGREDSHVPKIAKIAYHDGLLGSPEEDRVA